MRAFGRELAALAAHLRRQRHVILQTWRDAVRKDPSLTSGDSLPRGQLNDHIPAVLIGFERELESAMSDTDVTLAGNENAAAHGLHRWQQGYDLREVVRELGRLNVCMVAELEDYAARHPDLDPGAMVHARRLWAAACSVGIEESTAQYFRLQQAEAAGVQNDLENALEALRELERQRADLWREVAHDLRGNLSVVSNATAGLAIVAGGDSKGEKFLRMLQRNVTSLDHLLDDVSALARLQAGREERQLSEFDVAGLLRTLCEGLVSLAQQRGLSLHWEGPSPFSVEGDAVKIRRLAQNLILNAVKYTHIGSVEVRWGESEHAGSKRWELTVRDTGPGFHAGPGAPLAGALERATQLAHGTPGPSLQGASGTAPAPPPDSRPRHQSAGEGIGLSIVKRLSELLDASVELDSKPEVGTTVRVLLPRHYTAAAQVS